MSNTQKRYALVVRDAAEDEPEWGQVLEISDTETGLPVASMPVQTAAEILLKAAFVKFISST